MNSFFNSLFRTENIQTEPVENFASSADELLKKATADAQREVFSNPAIPSANRNKEIISILYDKDLFQLKDSVATVAKQLGLSKNTVYLHLRKLQAGL